jgi:hypothetical protein
MIKKLIEKLKTLRLYFVSRNNIIIRDKELSFIIIRIQHKIPRTGSVIFEYNGKYYKIKELG